MDGSRSSFRDFVGEEKQSTLVHQNHTKQSIVTQQAKESLVPYISIWCFELLMRKLNFLRTVYIYIITGNSRYAMYKEMAL